MPEPIDLEALHQAVLAQSKLIGNLLGSMSDERVVYTPDEHHELVDHCLGDLPKTVRDRYFAEVDRWTPRHSTQED